MFRRLSAGLPKYPPCPTDLKDLGYFINSDDEIRSIDNPKAYFKFFLTKNDRFNCIQREAMNGAIRDIVSERLKKLRLEKIRLPLGAKETERHVPIFISFDLKSKKRVVVLFYEPTQDLGIFAHRIIGGKGGINAGSAIDFVKYIQSQKFSDDNDDSPGIILANLGQLRWWRRGKKAVSQTTWLNLPQKSAVENSCRFDLEKNTIPGNRNPDEHINYIFNTVVIQLCHPAALLDIIGVADGAFRVSMFLDDFNNIKQWSKKIVAFAAVATCFQAVDIQTAEFANWFKDHGRAYITSNDPCDVFLAGPEGRKRTIGFGCPTFSLGEPYWSETMLPKGYRTVVNWFQEVGCDLEYLNPHFEKTDDGGESDDEVQDTWGPAAPCGSTWIKDVESIEGDGGVELQASEIKEVA